MKEIVRHAEIRIWIGKQRKGPLSKGESASPSPFANLAPKVFLLVMVAMPEHICIDEHRCTHAHLCQADTKALHVKWGAVCLGFLGFTFCSVTEMPH